MHQTDQPDTAVNFSLNQKHEPWITCVLQIRHFYQADPAYGTGIAKRLGLNISEIVGQKAQSSAAD